MKTFNRRLATVCLTMAASASAHATTSVYTSRTSFLDAVLPGAFTNSFTQPAGAAPSYSYSGNGYSYTIAAASRQLSANGARLGTSFNNIALTVTFTAGNTKAVGGNFFLTNSTGTLLAAPVTVSLSDGTTTTFTPSGQADSFRGFVSTEPITWLTMAAPGASRFNTVDNLVVGTAAAVPEAGTLVLLLAGGLAVIFRVRRTQST